MTLLGVAASVTLLVVQTPLVFPTSTEMVHVVVSVTDDSGQPIDGLRAEDFRVSEDGKQRTVASFTACGDTAVASGPACPVDLTLLWDTSTSMLDSLRWARDPAIRFFEKVRAGNSRTVVAFDSQMRVAAYDHANPLAAFDHVLSGDLGGATRLFDAVREGVSRAALDPTRRVIMVALTDGDDTGAWLQPDFAQTLHGLRPGDPLDTMGGPIKALARALQSEAMSFYAISFSKHLLRPDREAHARANLHTLAQATGGLVVDAEGADLDPEFDAIRRDLASQYVLGFVPGNSAPGQSHRIDVKVLKKDAKARHRLAYRAR